MNDDRRSKVISGTLLAAIAATIVGGCRSAPREVRRCVDDKGRELPEEACVNPTAYRTSHGLGYYPHWIYGGTRGSDGIYRGFRSTPTAGADIVSPSGRTISRGGFGSSSSSSSSFGG